MLACKSLGEGCRNFHVSKYNCIAASKRSVPKCDCSIAKAAAVFL